MVTTVDILRWSEDHFSQGALRKASVHILQLLLSNEPRNIIKASKDDYEQKILRLSIN